MSREDRCAVFVAWLIAGAGCAPDHDPAMRPYELFDRAETARAVGDQANARAAYRELVEWAAADPLEDGWGGSALVPYAFWRWTQYAGRAGSPDPDEVDAMLAARQSLRNTRLVAGIFSAPPHLDALPQLREESWRELALLAENAGRTNDARYLFLDYLAVTRNPVLRGRAAALRDRIVADRWATADGIDLMLANRHRQLGHNAEAMNRFERLTDNAVGSVRQQARLNLAQVRWTTRRDSVTRREVLEVLSRIIDEARNPDVLQQAYYLRGQVQVRAGAERSIPGFIDDMETLVREFPAGAYADEALLQLAGNYDARYRRTQDDADLESALIYYERLRELPTPHDREDSMYFRPAMALYARGLLNEATRAADLGHALDLLDQLQEANPQGPFRLSSLLWRARIEELRGNPARAEDLYEQLAAQDPYGYYGIRALMHLELGGGAAERLLPAGSAQERLIAAIPVGGGWNGTLNGTTPYHDRLRQLLTGSDRYRETLARLAQFRARAATRLHDVPLADLDGSGELRHLVLLLSLRQDAHAASAGDRGAANIAEVAAAVGHEAGDWPLALTLLQTDPEDDAEPSAVRQSGLYVRTAYPAVRLDQFAAAAADGVAPEVLYSIARRESRFSADAVSTVGAVGFFQFVPRTFCVLASRWEFVDPLPLDECMADHDGMFQYLSDPDRSIALGGHWVREELLGRRPSTDAGRLLALMDHNAGAPAVNGWHTQWQAMGQADDIEYMTETAGFPETRRFVRGVLGDTAVAAAAGLFHPAASDR